MYPSRGPVLPVSACGIFPPGEHRWPSPNFQPPLLLHNPPGQQSLSSLSAFAAAAGAIIVIATIRSLNFLSVGFSFFYPRL